MPLKRILSLSLITLTLAYFAVDRFFLVDRKPSLELHAGSALRHTEKVRGSIKTYLIPSEDKSFKVGDTLSLRGVVENPDGARNLSYRWKLPAGVELLAGETEGSIPDGMGQSYFDLTLKVNSLKNEQIHFHVSGHEGRADVAAVAQFNTQDQVDIKSLKSANRAKNLELLETSKHNGRSRPKIFH